MRDLEATVEVVETFGYLKNDLRDSILSGASFDTFNRLTFDRYVCEESERYASSSIDNFAYEVVEEAKEYYERIMEAFNDAMLLNEDSEESQSTIEVFDEVFGIVC